MIKVERGHRMITIIPAWRNLGCWGIKVGSFYADMFTVPYWGIYINNRSGRSKYLRVKSMIARLFMYTIILLLLAGMAVSIIEINLRVQHAMALMGQ